MILFEYNKNKGLGILKTEHLSEIREHFSTPNEGARFARMRGRFIPSRTYAITPTGQFDPCMFYEIIKFLVKNEYCQQSDIKTSSEFASQIIPSHIYKNNISFTNTPYDNMSLKLRDYQKEIVYQCLDKGRGVTVLATAGGKTLIMASLLSNFFMLNNQFKCLLIVPDLGLVNQTFNDFAQYGVPFFFNKWTGSDKLNANANVVIANLGIILSEKSDLSWLEGINVLVFDEIHKARRGNQINKILKQLNTPIRFGFTGTMPEDKLDQWNIIGKIGPIIYEKSSFELRKENFVTSVLCNILEISYNDKPKYVETLNPT
jgi:superfamily II DNA or RNA helicase